MSDGIRQNSALEMLPPGSFRPNPRNARIHSKRQIRQLAKTIRHTGFIGAIIIDEDNMIMAGHARWAAGKLNEMPLLPAIRAIGLSETQKRIFALADNKLNEWAGWDPEVLISEITSLADLLPNLELDLSITGFEPAELDALFSDRGSQPEPLDSLPEPDPAIVTRPGDLWQLSDHRLLCGNSLHAPDFDRLMAGARARMAFLDPPYNVRISNVQGRGRIKHTEFAYASGEMKPAEYVAFLNSCLGNAANVSSPGAVHYICHDWRHIREVAEAAEHVYGAALNLVVWVKTNAGQGSFYRSAHELIGVFRVGQAPHLNNVQLGRHGRNRSNVWTYPGISGFGVDRMAALAGHPTVKPTSLVVDAMRDCTAKGDIVVDAFMGSGTTILAAEKIGRKAYGLEFEPKFVDLAIRRWEDYTKRDATRQDGRTYADIRAEQILTPSTG